MYYRILISPDQFDFILNLASRLIDFLEEIGKNVYFLSKNMFYIYYLIYNQYCEKISNSKENNFS